MFWEIENNNFMKKNTFCIALCNVPVNIHTSALWPLSIEQFILSVKVLVVCFYFYQYPRSINVCCKCWKILIPKKPYIFSKIHAYAKRTKKTVCLNETNIFDIRPKKKIFYSNRFLVWPYVKDMFVLFKEFIFSVS